MVTVRESFKSWLQQTNLVCWYEIGCKLQSFSQSDTSTTIIHPSHQEILQHYKSIVQPSLLHLRHITHYLHKQEATWLYEQPQVLSLAAHTAVASQAISYELALAAGEVGQSDQSDDLPLWSRLKYMNNYRMGSHGT